MASKNGIENLEKERLETSSIPRNWVKNAGAPYLNCLTGVLVQLALACTVEGVVVRELTGWHADGTGQSIWLGDGNCADSVSGGT